MELELKIEIEAWHLGLGFRFFLLSDFFRLPVLTQDLGFRVVGLGTTPADVNWVATKELH